MSKSKDAWCAPIISRKGNVVSGGAARAVRIADLGGMEQIIDSVARSTLKAANNVAVNRARTKLRLAA